MRACVRTVTLLSSSVWPPRMMRERPSREGRPPEEAATQSATMMMLRVMPRAPIWHARSPLTRFRLVPSRKRVMGNDLPARQPFSDQLFRRVGLMTMMKRRQSRAVGLLVVLSCSTTNALDIGGGMHDMKSLVDYCVSSRWGYSCFRPGGSRALIDLSGGRLAAMTVSANHTANSTE